MFKVGDLRVARFVWGRGWLAFVFCMLESVRSRFWLQCGTFVVQVRLFGGGVGLSVRLGFVVRVVGSSACSDAWICSGAFACGDKLLFLSLRSDV